MNKQDVIKFFDACAPTWDAEMIKSDEIIEDILNRAGIREDTRLLDVACGTGVLFPYYAARGADVCGVDISPEMVRIAKHNFPDIEVICADATEISFPEGFGAVMVYNAFPHFPDPRAAVRALSSHLAPGGVLSVAHGMGRDMINRHHEGAASKVSRKLMKASSLAEIFSEFLDVSTVVDEPDRYIVCGICKKTNYPV
ncbi:MAG: class I SAM-dependent methyltransferase [Oscillospiraceae bacterium]|nr:class I SAM-dependent methyltransferase [Oscillospiraceae bacterium]